MKKIFKNLLKNPMLIVFLVILIFFAPTAIFAPGENRERGVVTAVGIDKVDDEYEVSFLVFIPSANQTFDDKESVITGKGNSVGEAVYEAQIAMGRKMGLYHAKTTIVNLELMEEDGINALDYFGRVAGLPENTVFICTDKTAKELLSSAQSLRDDLGFKLEQLVGYNATNIYQNETSLEAFYRGYYSPVKSSIVGFLTTTTQSEKEKFEMEVNSSESGQSSGDSMQGGGEDDSGSAKGGGSEEEPKSIINTGQGVIVKNGKVVKILSLDQINSINLLSNKSQKQVVKIEDINLDDEIVNAVYKVMYKNVNVASKFENGIPVFNANVVIDLSLIEIENATSKLAVNTEITKMTSEIVQKLDQKFKNDFAGVVKILKEEKTDVLGVTELFMKENRKDYIEYLKQGTKSEDFIENVVFKLELSFQTD